MYCSFRAFHTFLEKKKRVQKYQIFKPMEIRLFKSCIHVKKITGQNFIVVLY